jgi:hypothetical protein
MKSAILAILKIFPSSPRKGLPMTDAQCADVCNALCGGSAAFNIDLTAQPPQKSYQRVRGILAFPDYRRDPHCANTASCTGFGWIMKT